MNKRILRVIATLAVSLIIPASLGLPVMAEPGPGGSTPPTSTSGSGDSKPPTTTTTDVKTPPTGTPPPAGTPAAKTTDQKKHDAEVEKQHIEDATKTQEDMLKQKGKKELEDAKKDGTEHSAADRTKNCNEKKTGLEQKVANIKSNSAKHLAKIDAVLQKITDAQATTPTTGVDALLATAGTAKVTATASVNALSALAPTIDCTSTTVASDVATFKAAADQTRTDLKAYRDAVKAVLNAIENTPKATTTTGGTN